MARIHDIHDIVMKQRFEQTEAQTLKVCETVDRVILLAERRGEAEMAKLAIQQIEAAFTVSRDGGDAHSVAMFAAKLPNARALAQELAAR